MPLFEALSDVASMNMSAVNEDLHPARLGRKLRHETNPLHDRAYHPQVKTDEQLFAQGQDRS
jgi:hypothetical protein